MKWSLWYFSHCRSLGGSFWKASICFPRVCVFLLWSSINRPSECSVTANLIRSELEDCTWFHSSANQKKGGWNRAKIWFQTSLQRGPRTSQNSDSESPTEKKRGKFHPPKKKWPSKAVGILQDEDLHILLIDTKNRDSLSPNLALYHQTWHLITKPVSFFMATIFQVPSVCVFCCSSLPDLASKTPKLLRRNFELLHPGRYPCRDTPAGNCPAGN